jgi:hypothetical protein
MSEYYFRDWNKIDENRVPIPPWSDEEIKYLVNNPGKRMKIKPGENGLRTVADILDKNQYMKLTYDNISELAKKSDGLVGVYQLRMQKLNNVNDVYNFDKDLWWILLVKQIHGQSDNSDEIDEILITDPTDKYKEGIPITREEFREMYPPKEDPDGYYIKKASHPDIIRERLGAIKDNFNNSNNRLGSLPYNLANKISEFTEDVNVPLYKSNQELRKTAHKTAHKTDHDREAAIKTVNAEIENNRENEPTSYNPIFRKNGGKVKSRKKTKSKKRGKNKTSKKRRKNKTLKNRRKNKTSKKRRKNV